MHPRRKLGIVMIGGDDAAPSLFLEGSKLAPAFHPRGFVGIVTESQRGEFGTALHRHVRTFLLFHESVMTTLFLYPQAKLGIFFVIQRNVTMTVLGRKAPEVLHVP